MQLVSVGKLVPVAALAVAALIYAQSSNLTELGNSRVTPSPDAPGSIPPGQPSQSPNGVRSEPQTSASSPSYILGPSDQLSVDVAELEEFAGKSYRIDPDGTVSLPLIGRIPAAGLTLGQLEADITKRLYDQVKEPHVSAAVAESRSQPVSVLGSVNTPGVYQLQGGKRLFDVLSMAGGLKPDAGTTLRITRVQSAGPLPVPGAQEDQERKVNTAEINLRELVDGRNSSLNITVAPRDTISVPRADLVYVLGEVRKAGGFTISKKQVSALQALSMAEGLMPTAEPKKARVLRFVEGQDSRQEIPVNLKKLLAGSGGDVQLRPDDILFIPSNTAHRISVRAVEMAVTTLSGIIIWHGI